MSKLIPEGCKEKPKLCFVTAIPMTVEVFLRTHLMRLADDYALYVVSNFSAGIPTWLSGLAHCVHVPIQRRISPWADIRALLLLYGIMRRHRFALVQSVTPKAGLFGMLASRAAGVRHRLHWFTGQVWVTRTGFARAFLKGADRVTASAASALLADSRSQCDFLLAEGVCEPCKIDVIADGSICGVDTERFKPDAGVRSDIRKRHDIPEQASVILYLGRLSRDKGLNELAEAVPLVCANDPFVHFLFVGPDEDGFSQTLEMLAGRYPEQVHQVGYTNHPEHYMAAADVLCLPSYREGFGTVLIEAAAAGVAAVATRIYGLTDAVEDGVTGILVPVRDPRALADALLRLTTDHTLRAAMGGRARVRAVQHFSSARVTAALAAYYICRLGHD